MTTTTGLIQEMQKGKLSNCIIANNVSALLFSRSAYIRIQRGLNRNFHFPNLFGVSYSLTVTCTCV
jgi:hypothetical protein